MVKKQYLGPSVKLRSVRVLRGTTIAPPPPAGTTAGQATGTEAGTAATTAEGPEGGERMVASNAEPILIPVFEERVRMVSDMIACRVDAFTDIRDSCCTCHLTVI